MFRLFLLIFISVMALGGFGCQAVKSPPPENPLSKSPSPVAPSAERVPHPSPSKPTAEQIKAASSYRLKGLEYRSQQRYTEAIQAFYRAVDLDPQNISGRVLLGWTLHLAGREPEAITELKKTLSFDANNVAALNALGIVYLVSGNLPLAVETHHRAIKLKADNEIAHYNLSLAYHLLKNYEQGIIHGKEATVLEPENPHPWVALALVYWEKGDKLLAQQTYQKAINLDGRYRESWFLGHLKEAGFSSGQIQQVEKIRQSV